MLSAHDVADYFILKTCQEKKPLSNKKLQKLLYYAQAWHLVFNKKKLFSEEIEAWIHGPAVRQVYGRFRHFGFDAIDVEPSSKSLQKIKDTSFLDEVWKIYGKYDAEYLVELTHNEYPWQKAREGLEAHLPSNRIISTDIMRDYYTRLLEDARKN